VFYLPRDTNDLVQPNIPQQKNHADCGIHVCINMMRVLGLSGQCEAVSDGADTVKIRSWLDGHLRHYSAVQGKKTSKLQRATPK
jgi:Ulp1 family protease